MTKIWERLYLGSFSHAERLAAANALGIKAVLTMAKNGWSSGQLALTTGKSPSPMRSLFRRKHWRRRCSPSPLAFGRESCLSIAPEA